VTKNTGTRVQLFTLLLRLLVAKLICQCIGQKVTDEFSLNFWKVDIGTKYSLLGS